MRRLLTILAALMLSWPMAQAQQPLDSIAREAGFEGSPMHHAFRSGLPLIGIGLGYNLYNSHVRDIRQAYVPKFRHHFDDYTQFAPLAVQLGLRLAKVGGSSRSLRQMLLGDLFASGAMLIVVSTTKELTAVQRPDGSSRNSFPSGHTAMAFTSATLLHLEYGARYPWLSSLAYAAASAAGVGRILNNRHWIGDVVTGAGVGILSGHLGYWLSDLLLPREQRRGAIAGSQRLFDDLDLCLLVPVRYASHSPQLPSRGLRADLVSAGIGLGLRYASPKRHYTAHLEARAERHRLEYPEGEGSTAVQAASMSLGVAVGREFSFIDRRLRLEPMLALEAFLGKGQEPQTGPSLSAVNRIVARAQLSASWCFTERLGFRLDGGYYLGSRQLKLSELGGEAPASLSLSNWSVGSSLIFAL